MFTTLHDLLARGVALEWFEAVAIVQALCKRLLDEPPSTGIRVPDLHDIVLNADGTVEPAGEGPSSQSAVFSVGGNPMPVPLRLLALTAVSPSPPYGSVAELSSALEFYERPGRQEIVRAVYARFEKLPAASQAAAAVEEIPAAPPPVPKTSGPRWWRLHPRIVAAAVTVLLAVSAVSGWLMIRSMTPWLSHGSRQVAVAVGATTDTIARTVSSGVRAVKEQLGLADATPVDPEAPPPAPDAAVAANVPRQTPALLPSRGEALRPGGVAILPPPSVPGLTLDHPIEAAAESAALLAPTVGPGEWTIYSAENPDVVPPSPLHAKMPSEPPQGVPVDSLPLLELVISAGGEVESARLMTPSPNVSVSMMVSAVKAWRFQPATRNGQPVRYRLLMRLTSQ
jgi:hypothetical protein